MLSIIWCMKWLMYLKSIVGDFLKNNTFLFKFEPYSYKYLKFSLTEWIMSVYYQGVLNIRGSKKIVNNHNTILYQVDYFVSAQDITWVKLQSSKWPSPHSGNIIWSVIYNKFSFGKIIVIDCHAVNYLHQIYAYPQLPL